jgi:formylglycine-generating enzyme required for sulfatase activity
VCIPGGYSVLGEPALVGVLQQKSAVDPIPRRPLRLTSFWMDRTEMTVGRFRARAAELKGSLPRPRAQTGIDQLCTWLGPSVGTNDELPLNCVERATASEMCALLGGRLPTEAEWEHAARGHGRGFRYPWGEEAPTCCAASASRGFYCPGSGLERVGSHPNGVCNDFGDESVDGVLDLAGSVAELVDGDILAYDAACWQGSGIPLDPYCDDPTLTVNGTRGGDFQSGLGVTAAPLRILGTLATPWEGFRCVYEDSP